MQAEIKRPRLKQLARSSAQPLTALFRLPLVCVCVCAVAYCSWELSSVSFTSVPLPWRTCTYFGSTLGFNQLNSFLSTSPLLLKFADIIIIQSKKFYTVSPHFFSRLAGIGGWGRRRTVEDYERIVADILKERSTVDGRDKGVREAFHALCRHTKR